MNDALLKEILAQGFPTVQDEAWKYTNVYPIAQREFKLASSATVTKEALVPYLLCEHFLVFINGYFILALSNLPQSLRLEKLPSQKNMKSNDIFGQLNQHFFQDGLSLAFEKSELATPVQILYLSTEAAWVQPRLEIQVAANARASVIETFHSTAAAITNAVTTITVQANAECHYFKLQQEAHHAFHIGRSHFVLHEKAQAHAYTISFGAALARSDVTMLFQGENAACRLYGLYLAKGRQHLDQHTIVDHAVPGCKSYEFYRGILAEHARGVFNGKVIVRPAAHHSEAEQFNHNLLLSADAEIDTKPELEIYHDEVKCTHGAAIGQLDDDAIFYLRSRGLNLAAAKQVLINGFANKVIEKIPVKSLRDYVSEKLYDSINT